MPAVFRGTTLIHLKKDALRCCHTIALLREHPSEITHGQPSALPRPLHGEFTASARYLAPTDTSLKTAKNGYYSTSQRLVHYIISLTFCQSFFLFIVFMV